MRLIAMLATFALGCVAPANHSACEHTPTDCDEYLGVSDACVVDGRCAVDGAPVRLESFGDSVTLRHGQVLRVTVPDAAVDQVNLTLHGPPMMPTADSLDLRVSGARVLTTADSTGTISHHWAQLPYPGRAPTTIELRIVAGTPTDTWTVTLSSLQRIAGCTVCPPHG